MLLEDNAMFDWGRGGWKCHKNICFFGVTESAVALSAASAAASGASVASAIGGTVAAVGAYGGATAALSSGFLGISAATWSTLGTVGSLLGTGIGAIGQMQQGRASAASASYNAAIANQNAELARRSAVLAGAAGNAQTEQALLKSRAKVGGIIAGQAASGIDVNSGSALDVRSSAKELGELNALTVRSNAARTAYGYQTQQTNYSAEAGLDQFASDTALPAAGIAAGGTILGGVSDAASRYAQFQLQAGNSINSNPYG